jgi:hypothetical protein
MSLHRDLRSRVFDIAEIDSRPDHGHHLLLVLGRSVAEAHPHTAEPDRRNFQITSSELALLHGTNIGRCASRFSRFRAPPSAILREKKGFLVRMQCEIRSAPHR